MATASVLASCSRKQAEQAPAGSATPAATAATDPAATPASAPAAVPAMQPSRTGAPIPVADSGATAGLAPSSGATPTATGRVVETMDSGGYTYVRLDTGGEKIWAATAPIKVKVGQELTVPLEMPMQNFHSSTLNRDFAVIYFASRVARGGEPLPARPPMPTAAERADAGVAPAGQPVQTPAPSAQGPGQKAIPPGHPPIGAGASTAPITVTEVIPPAKGGHSIADVWARRASMAGTPVTVRGKVVKFLPGIMGRNWLHLQDGTGNAKDGTNDITVTTDADAKPGDIVTATGALAIDKDFGAGYKYGAIVESATIVK